MPPMKHIAHGAHLRLEQSPAKVETHVSLPTPNSLSGLRFKTTPFLWHFLLGSLSDSPLSILPLRIASSATYLFPHQSSTILGNHEIDV